MLRIKIRNNFIDTSSSASTVNSKKVITLPINIDFTPTDYEEQREEILKQEREKSINKPIDGETIKYNKDGNPTTINVNFYNGSSFVKDYTAVGFDSIDFSRKAFKKSYYRLYFYDGLDDNNNNLLFIEDVVVKDKTPTFNFDRVFWLKNQDGDRDIYMDAKFFNAKNGKIHKLINSNQTTPPSHATITQNREWLKKKMTLKSDTYTLMIDNTIELTEDIRS